MEQIEKTIKVGSDFSGVGAFEQAINRLKIKYETIFACDKDKYARITYTHNYGHPKYYPDNVYNRNIPEKSLDIYMTSPPCQSFSLAGNRLGKGDNRGILFFNSHEFITKNKPRFFIFENVKGLLSDDNGKTFSEWLHLLGGKSVNGTPVIFPFEGSTPYHIYWSVLNAKDYGIPQNRERVFIIGIRDDHDNNYSFPKPIHLTKRLKDVLEDNVDKKYFLSDKMMEYFTNRASNFNNGNINFKDESSIASTITSSSSSLDISDNIIVSNKDFDIVGNINKGGELGLVFSEDSRLMNCLTSTYYKQPKQIQQAALIHSGSLSGGKWDNMHESARRYYSEDGIAPTIHTCNGGNTEPKVQINTDKPIAITHNSVHSQKRIYNTEGISPTILSGNNGGGQSPVKHLTNTHAIRKLTPRECFRLMDFPDTFDFSVVSNSQAYKQAGNSICVGVLSAIISKLKL